MNNFNLEDYWSSRYLNGGNSGAGSYNEEARFKASYINHCISKFNLKTIVELGCGDGNQLSLFKGYDLYFGYDISKYILESNNKRFAGKDSIIFTDNLYNVPDGDVRLSLDVIFHQINDNDYFNYLNHLFKSEYVIIYSTDHNDNSLSAKHVRHRNFSADVLRLFNNYKLIDNQQGYYKSVYPDLKIFNTYKKIV